MPSTSDVGSVVRAIGPDRYGAGEPSGEPAPPPGILDRVPDEIRSQLPDELVDQLLAGAKSEEEIVGPGGLLSQLTQRMVDRCGWGEGPPLKVPRHLDEHFERGRPAYAPRSCIFASVQLGQVLGFGFGSSIRLGKPAGTNETT